MLPVLATAQGMRSIAIIYHCHLAYKYKPFPSLLSYVIYIYLYYKIGIEQSLIQERFLSRNFIFQDIILKELLLPKKYKAVLIFYYLSY